jgi:hypothetical protein
MKSLNESNVPKKAFTSDLEINSIEKCLWIFCEKFNFATTTKVKVTRVQSLKSTLLALLDIKFPMLILVESKLAIYHHMVVVWQQRVIVYKSMITYPLTEESLRQICGVNTIQPLQGLAVGMASFPQNILAKNQRMGV